jgi:hypothetical protein
MKRVRVYVTEKTGDSPGRVTILAPGDTMEISHKVSFQGKLIDGEASKTFTVADIKVVKE